MKQNYEDTKADLPWLQLEEDNLDNISLSSGVEITYLPRTVDAQKAESSLKSIVRKFDSLFDTCIYFWHIVYYYY